MANEKVIIQTFWNSICKANLTFEPPSDGSAFYREGDFVFYKHRDVDEGENRTYECVGKFQLKDYRRVLRDIEQGRTAILRSEEGSEMTFALGEDGKVHYRFSENPSSFSTHSENPLSETIQGSCDLEVLILRDNVGG